MLRSVLEANITKNIVRFGSRSSDELIAQYSLMELEKVGERGSMQQALRREYAAMKRIEEETERVMNSIQAPFVHWSKVKEYLEIHKPEVAESFGGENTPFWISELHRMLCEEEEEGEWKTVVRGGGTEEGGTPKTLYGFWRKGLDLHFITPLPSTNSDSPSEGYLDTTLHFFFRLGFEHVPPLPDQFDRNRSVHELEGIENLWGLPPWDRSKLAKHWEQEIRRMAYAANLGEFQDLRVRYKDACKEYENVQNEVRNIVYCSQLALNYSSRVVESSCGERTLLVVRLRVSKHA